ncbi:MAG: oxygen-independent coproporphyrinogen III oxidase [Vicinamibacteria bacterium]|nr:oxygen-independent coproporphyrinogen III oxidase [Vicinamibacteria bacterium]
MRSDAFAVTVDLLRRYDRPGPRYTSYPTAVEFHAGFDERAYRDRLAGAAAAVDQPLSLYLHLPFCEQRCTFCGCMVIITKKREVAATYLTYLKREIAMLGEALGGRRRVLQYHWGGGTPTYLSPAQMADLHAAVAAYFDMDASAEEAIEVDPRVTTVEQLGLLRTLGFNRLSMGVQDFTPAVQAAVNRIQPVETTRALFDRARDLGFDSINVDLIYGLPLQTRASFAATVDTVLAMRPDRVAVYSFALVPWIRAHQKGLPMADLPGPEAKLELFVEAMQRFLAAGYRQIGMDHFALPDDELAKASEAGHLHRNFMGYTTRPAPDMVGAGVSAIGDVDGAFAQNVKSLSSYYAALDAGAFPIERGYRLDVDDRLRRFVITELMCNFRVRQADVCERFGVALPSYFALEIEELARGPVADGFVRITSDGLEVTQEGRLFVRNIAMHFDRYLRRKTSVAPVFSRTI